MANTTRKRHIGYGAAHLSCGERPSNREAEELLQRILQSGVFLIDTADTYCWGPDELHHGERLLLQASHRTGLNEAIIATKGGTVRTVDGWEINGRPENIDRAIRQSYEALGGEKPIPLWQHHWPDPRYKIAEIMQVADAARKEGLIDRIGVCNYSQDEIEEAREVTPIFSVQNQFNFWRRDDLESGLIEYCTNENILYLSWRPFGGPGLADGLLRIETVREIAKAHEATSHQIVLAWILRISPCLVPIPGSRRWEHFINGQASLQIDLSDSEFGRLCAIESSEIYSRKRPAAWRDSPPLSGQ